jgi:hypothetical protein
MLPDQPQASNQPVPANGRPRRGTWKVKIMKYEIKLELGFACRGLSLSTLDVSRRRHRAYLVRIQSFGKTHHFGVKQRLLSFSDSKAKAELDYVREQKAKRKSR